MMRRRFRHKHHHQYQHRWEHQWDHKWHDRWHQRHAHARWPWRLQSRFRHSLGAKLTVVFLVQAVLVGVAVHLFDQQRVGWGWAAAGVVFMTLVAYGSIRRTLRPLRALAAGAAAFSRGHLNYRIHVHHRDEIADLADRFNQMAQDIAAMLDAKRELLLAISHELRSPLTRARLNAELLDERGPSHSALLKELALMRDLIEDLLERERLDAGHTALKLAEVDLRALIDELIDRRFVEAIEQGRLVISFSDDLPTHACLDKTRVQLLLGNLVDNALRYNDVEQGPVELDAWASAGQLHWRVRDHGPGVPPEALLQLGQPFFRPESARTREGGGVGLGLNLCRLVAEAHGGELKLRNAQPGFEAEAILPGA